MKSVNQWTTKYEKPARAVVCADESNCPQDELGDSILAICQGMRAIGGSSGTTSHHTNLDGGILVFFPSYGVMESVAARWKQTGTWESLCAAGGHVIMEPRRSAGASEGPKPPTDRNGAKKWKDVDDSDAYGSVNGDTSHMGVVREFETALETKGKCILLAVCR